MIGFRRALVISTADRYFALVSNFVGLAVISRILTPSEIGVSVIGMSIAAFGQAVRELATTNFIIQRPVLTTDDVRVTFTILLLVTLAITGTIVSTAGLLAQLYSEPRLQMFLYIAALAILMELISAPIAALLRRRMEFGVLALITSTGALINVSLTIALAMLGESYMSFAWAWLASTVWISLLSWIVWKDRSIFIPSLRNWRQAASFGVSDGIGTVLYAIYDTIPYFILGRVLSFDAAALYNRGVMVSRLPDKLFLGGLSSILLSALSSELRMGKPIEAIYLRGIELLTGVLWPALLFIALLSHWIVQVLFGQQWLGAAGILSVMAIASLFSFSRYLNHPVLLAVGATRELLKRSLIIWPVSAVIAAAASLRGLEAASLSMLITIPFQAYISLVCVYRYIDIGWKDVAMAFRSSAIVALCSTAGPLAIVLLHGFEFPAMSPLPLLAILLCGVGWFAGLWFTSHPLLDEIDQIVGRAMSIPGFGWLGLGRRLTNPGEAPQ
jgi:O-antigen/teichoic acid export membrane protein